jgi:methylated-DNA-[protein]-cysteine S-methyltransferase
MGHSEHLATIFHTQAGWAALCRTGKGLRWSTHSHPSRDAAEAAIPTGFALVPEASDPLLARAARLVQSYFAGEPVAFDLPLDLTDLAPFTQAALLACHAIQYGSTATYGDVARRAGNRRAARAAGQAMSRNPLAPIIPCHRVLGSHGSLGGFRGRARDLEAKRQLLELEGYEPTRA